RVRNHWFAADQREQFVEAHSFARAGGDDDCTQHVEPFIARLDSTTQLLNCFCTSALSVLPSARPATFAWTAFITAPIWAFEVAPTSAIASRTAFERSSALIACGK